MALVHRFTLPWAQAAGHDVFVAGLGLFTNGVLDVPPANTTLITLLQAASGVTDAGTLDNSSSPSGPPPGSNDPYPQYLTAAEVASAVSSGIDPISAALKAATTLPMVGSYTYNADGTVASGPAGETYAYNSDGTVHSVTLNGVTRTYSYNSDGTVASAA